MREGTGNLQDAQISATRQQRERFTLERIARPGAPECEMETFTGILSIVCFHFGVYALPMPAESVPLGPEEAELRSAIGAILGSPSRKKLVVAGPGTGKTTLFRMLLEMAPGEPTSRLVLTFINTLKNELEKDLGSMAQVHTLHSYCLGLLHRDDGLRGNLTPLFRCCPGLSSLVSADWEFVNATKPPNFLVEMRNLAKDNHLAFYLSRGEYYDAVDFDDSVYRAYEGLVSGRSRSEEFDLVLIDEYQDFNSLEAGVIDALGLDNPILIAGDDDQALYSQLRDSSWDHIRLLSRNEAFQVFELPFCLRCPKVVVDAVSDIIQVARKLNRLEGRINKPYRHYPPAKGTDSARYPKIMNVFTTVQRKAANYMGRYIAQQLNRIPQDEIDEATAAGYPVALVIAADPYRTMIQDHLQGEGHSVNEGSSSEPRTWRDMGLAIVKEQARANIGWRIVLHEDHPPFLRDLIIRVEASREPLLDLVPDEYRARILSEAEVYRPQPAHSTPEQASSPTSRVPAMVTTYEGAKGLSAQHVFIAGLHDGELPRDPTAVKDIEICKLIVGLTRTRKLCTLIHTGNFGGMRKTPSSFMSWIRPDRYTFQRIDKTYWEAA